MESYFEAACMEEDPFERQLAKLSILVVPSFMYVDVMSPFESEGRHVLRDFFKLDEVIEAVSTYDFDRHSPVSARMHKIIYIKFYI